jgi:hypothetical protein
MRERAKKGRDEGVVELGMRTGNDVRVPLIVMGLIGGMNDDGGKG